MVLPPRRLAKFWFNPIQCLFNALPQCGFHVMGGAESVCIQAGDFLVEINLFGIWGFDLFGYIHVRNMHERL